MSEIVKVEPKPRSPSNLVIRDRAGNHTQITWGLRLNVKLPAYFYAEWKTNHWELGIQAPQQDW